MKDSEFTVERLLDHRQGNIEYYTLSVPHGYADVTFETVVGWLGVANIQVEDSFRRQGRAKALLEHIGIMAMELDASLIYASIISRESIDTFVSVFGVDAVSVKKRGRYGSIGGAEAFLKVDLY